jgi:hypothetical protein
MFGFLLAAANFAGAGLSATRRLATAQRRPERIRLLRPAFHHYPRALAQRDPRCWPARKPPPGRNKKPRRSGARTMLLPLEDELPNEFDRLIAFRGNRFAAR